MIRIVKGISPSPFCTLFRLQARVTSVYANNGVVQDRVFFSLNSLLVPANYQPSPGDLVNLVMVESSQSLYSWRALCMAPCHQRSMPTFEMISWDVYSCFTYMSVNPFFCSLKVSKPEAPPQNIFENKEGIVVSDYGKFGNVMIGEKRELVFWIE